MPYRVVGGVVVPVRNEKELRLSQELARDFSKLSVIWPVSNYGEI